MMIPCDKGMLSKKYTVFSLPTITIKSVKLGYFLKLFLTSKLL